MITSCDMISTATGIPGARGRCQHWYRRAAPGVPVAFVATPPYKFSDRPIDGCAPDRRAIDGMTCEIENINLRRCCSPAGVERRTFCPDRARRRLFAVTVLVALSCCGEDRADSPALERGGDGSVDAGRDRVDGGGEDDGEGPDEPDPDPADAGPEEPGDGGGDDVRDASKDGQDAPEDIDSCEPEPCFAGVECTDLAPPDEGYICGPCPDGYEGDGETCSDIPECETDNGGCGELQTCIEVVGGPPRCSDKPTTRCVLTFQLEIGNGDDSSGYTGCNMRLRDTAAGGAVDGTHAVGPGTLVIRLPSDGGQKPAAGKAEILFHSMIIEYSTENLGTTITTDLDAASPDFGAEDNDEAVATGRLSLGAAPEITWDDCELPAGYDDDPEAYTPDITATGDGCMKPYRSTGNISCTGSLCSLAALAEGDNPRDDTWEQRLEPLYFTADLKNLSMPMMQIPNRAPSRTYVSVGGSRTSISCTP
jgi:hypothetical protein